MQTTRAFQSSPSKSYETITRIYSRGYGNDASRCSAYLQIKRSACYFRRQNTSFLPATFLTRMNYVYCASFTNRGSAYYFTEKFRRTSNNHWLCFFVFFFFEEMTHVSRTMRLNGDKKRHNEGVVETNCK